MYLEGKTLQIDGQSPVLYAIRYVIVDPCASLHVCVCVTVCVYGRMCVNASVFVCLHVPHNTV